jgi:WXG100 family type VII secretion target
MGQVHATQDQLNSMARRCDDTGRTLASGMAQLIEQIQSLSGAGMSGAANTALQNSSSELNQGLTRILNALDELAGKISNTSTQLGTHDDEAAQEIRSAAQATGNPMVKSILTGQA